MRMTALKWKGQQVLCVLLACAIQHCSAQTEGGEVTRTHTRTHTGQNYISISTYIYSDKSIWTHGLRCFDVGKKTFYLTNPRHKTCSAHVKLVCGESPTPLPRLCVLYWVCLNCLTVSGFCDSDPAFHRKFSAEKPFHFQNNQCKYKVVDEHLPEWLLSGYYLLWLSHWCVTVWAAIWWS